MSLLYLYPKNLRIFFVKITSYFRIVHRWTASQSWRYNVLVFLLHIKMNLQTMTSYIISIPILRPKSGKWIIGKRYVCNVTWLDHSLLFISMLRKWFSWSFSHKINPLVLQLCLFISPLELCFFPNHFRWWSIRNCPVYSPQQTDIFWRQLIQA